MIHWCSPSSCAHVLHTTHVTTSSVGFHFFVDLMQGKASKGVKKFVDQKGLIQVSDPAQIEAIVDAVIAANQKQLEQYRAGKTKLQGHFVG